MPKILQLRRGTTAELAANTPASGELFVDTQQKTVTVGDGSLAGGTYLATDARVSAAYNTANGANGLASGAFNTANGANGLAQGAFNVANTKFNSTGGVISGSVTISANNNLTVTGNLTVLGNTFSVSSQTLEVVDPMIILANGNFSSDAVDIGFAGHYNNGSNAHTGLFRDFASKDWYLFQGYTPELSGNNNINIADASFDTANLIAKRVNANVVATTVTIAGRDQASVDSTQNTNITSVNQFAQGAYNTANGANGLAGGAFNTANGANGMAVGAHNRANSAFTQANNANGMAVGAFNAANTAASVASSASTTATGANGLAAGAFTTANGANGLAASAFHKANGAVNFGTIYVAGQPNVIANTANAGLTFVAGSGMTITTSGTSNTITFTSSGGGGGGTSYDQSLNTTDPVTFNSVGVTPRHVRVANTAWANTDTRAVGDIPHIIDTFSTTLYGTAKYLIYMIAPQGYNTVECTLLHDGSSAFLTTSSNVFSNVALGTFGGTVVSGNVSLQLTYNYANTRIEFVRDTIAYVSNVTSVLPEDLETSSFAPVDLESSSFAPIDLES